MHTLEALLSLLFFTTIVLYLIPNPEHQQNQLYKYQIAQDAWRILYLRSDLHNMTNLSRVQIESDMAVIGNMAGLCFFLNGIEFTNCRSGENHTIILSISKTTVYYGSPKKFTFSIAPR